MSAAAATGIPRKARWWGSVAAGATVGHILKTEQWSRIIPAPHAGLRIESAPGGLALRLSASI